ncbi:MAG: hypothetical protein JXR48_02195 [Candidatus Delongbacteria bacterium]|nr:hypothetical protein [Candidatus Delongbacteria bacterium]MBN2833757.1 hypothetical protein [Candidatus Delongbacteria bacterium]
MKTSFLFIILFVTFLSASEWIAKDSKRQLIEEGVDDHIGMGRIFIPVMTKKSWEEPVIRLFRRDNSYNYNAVLKQKAMGESIFLEPGNYRLIFGSAIEQEDMIQKEFNIVAGETKILEPDWGCLLVKVIDENREEQRIGYEIYHLDQEISLGSKYSRDATDYERQLDTWIIKPGKYKIVKAGEPYNTIINFTTFQLETGELKQLTIVVDSKTKEFKGAGEIKDQDVNQSQLTGWKEMFTIKGSLSFNSDNLDNEDDSNSEVEFNGKIKNQLRYDIRPWFINLIQTIETDMSKVNEDDLKLTNDKFEVANTLIYYFTSIFGVYGDLTMKTEIFSNNIYYGSARAVRKISSDGEVEEINDDKVEVSPALFPMTTSEEIGLNLLLLDRPSANLYVRSGLGLEQTYNKDVFEKVETIDDVDIYEEIANKSITGMVFKAGADIRLFNNLNYTGEARFLKSFENESEYNFEWENNFVFNIFQYLALEYDLDFKFSDQKDYLAWNHGMKLEFSYYFNR